MRSGVVGGAVLSLLLIGLALPAAQGSRAIGDLKRRSQLAAPLPLDYIATAGESRGGDEQGPGGSLEAEGHVRSVRIRRMLAEPYLADGFETTGSLDYPPATPTPLVAFGEGGNRRNLARVVDSLPVSFQPAPIDAEQKEEPFLEVGGKRRKLADWAIATETNGTVGNETTTGEDAVDSISAPANATEGSGAIPEAPSNATDELDSAQEASGSSLESKVSDQEAHQSGWVGQSSGTESWTGYGSGFGYGGSTGSFGTGTGTGFGSFSGTGTGTGTWTSTESCC